MRKRTPSQLDEMQQAKLLKINSNGMNLCYIGLLAAILIQWLVKRDFSAIIGEVIVFYLLMFYITGASIYEGLWSSKVKPSIRSNLLISLIPAAAVGILLVLRNALSADASTVLSAPVILLLMGIAYALCMAVLSALLCLYNRRRSVLDEQENE